MKDIMNWFTVWCGLMAMVTLSCRDNRFRINVSAIKDEIPVVRYENELFARGPQPDSVSLAGLHARYPEFTDLFSYRIVRIGTLNDTTGRRMIHEFLTDSAIRLSRQKIEKLYPDQSAFEKELVRAFKHFRYYFPEKPVPVIYTCISGFNEPVFISGKMLGISLDKYLGPGCEFYSLLGIPQYKQRKMKPEMIAGDVIQAWVKSVFPISREATTLCDNMVYEGKILCFMQALSPEMADTLLFEFSPGQLQWCKTNESQMWNYLIEHQLLFSTRQMDIVRYINDGPTTNGFPAESPGRTGTWLGWNIVRHYMKRHPEVTLPELMKNDHYQDILNASGYAP
jgi:hypothetical protein